jgi:hypothetical protein
VLRLRGNEVRPGHRGELRVLVAARRTGLGQLRAYLVADLVRRTSERSGVLPSVSDLLPDGEKELRALCAELNIHPPLHTLTPPVQADQLGGLFPGGARSLEAGQPVFDVGVRAVGESAGDPGVGHWIEVADAAEGAAEEAVALVAEPLAVRMMLMGHGYGETLDTVGDLDAAAKTLARWRARVAEWARSPSGAMSRRYAEAITAAFADDLNAAVALRELAAIEDDPGEPDGVKFETFAAADRLLGLDLAREIGR